MGWQSSPRIHQKVNMDTKKQEELDTKRDFLISELMLRISCLEKLIIEKTSITETDVTTAYAAASAKLMDLVKEMSKQDAKSS